MRHQGHLNIGGGGMNISFVYALLYSLVSHTVKNGSLLQHSNVSLLGHVSKIVSILLSKLAIVALLTHCCVTVTTHF